MNLRQLFSSIPGGVGGDMARDMDNMEGIRAQGQGQGGKRPEDMSPQELHATLWQILEFRDNIVKKIEKTIQKIPGLGPLIEKLMDGISVFVFTILEPFLKPILKTATSGLSSASAEVIDNHDQYEVFNDARASDPTHSFLSKDHFNLILNEPAGLVATAVVKHTVQLVVKAWSDDGMSPDRVADDACACLFHPDFPSRMPVQSEMLATVAQWAEKQKPKIFERLTKQAVRNHENIRLAGEGGAPEAVGSFAQTQGLDMQNKIGGYLQGAIPGGASSFLGGGNQGHKSGTSREFYDQGPSSHGSSSGYGGSSHGGSSMPPAPGSGSAADFYQQDSHHAAPSHGGGGHHQQQQHQSSYAAPSGPPPGKHDSYSSAPSFPGGPSSHQPPSFPGAGPPGGGGGYAPSYMSPPPGGGPSFPGAQPNYGGHYGGDSQPHYGGGPPPPMGFPGPQFPGGPPPGGPPGGYAPSYGSSPPPQFPDANSGYPGQHHHGHHGSGY